MPDSTPQTDTITVGNTVTAPINFMTHDQPERPSVRMLSDHATPNPRYGNFELLPLTIHDARALSEPASLDREGFALSELETAVTDFFDESQVENVYYPEIIEFLRRETGASAVHIFDHTIRIQDDAKREATARRLPVLIAHNDYT